MATDVEGVCWGKPGHEPASIATLAGILVLSVVLDYGWKHFHAGRTKNVQLAH